MVLREFESYREWLRGLRDRQAAAWIKVAVNRLQNGITNNCKSLGQNVWELKIDKGPGYRVYFLRHGNELVILLCGGDKGSQSKDIRSAYQLAEIARRSYE